MKKNFAAIIALLLALVMTFAACVTDEETPETPPAEYTVTFDTDGGSVIAPVKVKEGEKVSRPADPTKSGWSFAGWYADEGTSTAFGFNEGLQTVGDFAFYNSDLASAVLPSSLSTVGSGIFYGCATDVAVPFAEDALHSGWSSSWNNKNTGTVTYTPAS